MDVAVWTAILYTLMGLLGGLTYVLIKARTWEDVVRFRYAKRILLGAIIGLVYFQLHSEYSFPNTIMAWVAGYMGSDAVIALIDRFKPRPHHSRR